VRDRLHEIYLVKGVQATIAIEGNTLSQQQVHDRLAGRLETPPSQEYLVQECDNISNACNTIGRRIANSNISDITPELLCEYNKMVLEDLELPEEVQPGVFRKHSIVVGDKYRGPDQRYFPMLVERLCQWLDADFTALKRQLQSEAVDILKAVVAHLYIAWIHPFGDGNGRTARLLEFDILLRAGVPSPAAHLLSNHYNQTRTEYYRRLDLTSKKRTPVDFIEYAVLGLRDGLDEQLGLINDQMRDIVWRNYVYERFRRDVDSKVARRRRHVVLDVSRQDSPAERKEIPTLTPRLRKAYRNKTDKTLARDLAALCEMGLLLERRGKYSPNLGLIDAFLPMRRKQDLAADVID